MPGRRASSEKGAEPVDLFVGAKLRARRLELNMSQTALADAVGLTFQQVQKYEKGTNRIAPSRLQVFATVLGVPVAYFFPIGPDPVDSATISPAEKLMQTRQGLRLAEAFVALQGHAAREALVQLAEAMAGIEQEVRQIPLLADDLG